MTDEKPATPTGPLAADTRALDGRVVAVTGAARGLGRAYALALAAGGATVVANDLDADALEQCTTSLAARGGAVRAVPGDASTADGAETVVRAALDRFGRLDAVVANAGMLRSGPILRVTADDVDAVLAVHVRGTVLLARAAGTYWRAQAKAGRPVDAALVTTTSSAGLYGFRAEAIYSAAKAAVAAFTLVAADELRRYGVTVNAIAPVARTRLTAWMGEAAGEPADDPFAPEHVAPLVCWLVGPHARHVTGRVFEAGGGVLAVADGWRQAATAVLPPLARPEEAGRLVDDLLRRAPEPRPLVGATLPGQGQR